MSAAGHDFGLLYRRHSASVFRRAHQLLKREDEAYEVVQDLFLSFIERPEQLLGKASLTGWLYSATTHACLNRLRNRKNRVRLLNLQGPPREVDGRLTPDGMAMLHDTLHMLPPPLGEVAVYAFFDGMSHEEIAKLVGCSRSHVANLLERILAWGKEEEGGIMYGELSEGPEGCVSDLRIDAHLARELDGAEQAALHAHLEHCARCKARFVELERASVAYYQGVRSQAIEVALATRARARPKKARMVAVFSGFALAALALLAVLPRTPDDGTRGKGQSRIGFFVKHGQNVRKGRDGETVMPGDQLRFTYSVSHAAYLTVLGFDETKAASLYFAAWVSVGQNKPLPSALELDETLGVERIYGLFCPQEVAAEALRQKLERVAGALVPEAGCELHQLRLVKVERP